MPQEAEAVGTRPARHARGFTLLEMLLVSGLILLLAGLLVAAGADLRKKALIRETEDRIAVLEAAIEHFYAQNRRYPNATEFGDLIVDRTDAWGNLINYKGQDSGTGDPTHNTKTYDLWSAGPDGDESTEEDNINNWSRL